MSLMNLVNATVACGGVSFLVYSFPILSQAVIIGVLTLLWLSYATKTIGTLRKR